MTSKELMELAKEARQNAYCKYSNFSGGAALLARSGKIYLGCNIENASFTPTNCAERTSFFSAIAAGEREFEAIAVCGAKSDLPPTVCMPCGVCRQVMAEFCSQDFPVYVMGENEKINKFTLGELLPSAFNI